MMFRGIYCFTHLPDIIGHFQWSVATYSRVLETNERESLALRVRGVCGGVELVAMVSN